MKIGLFNPESVKIDGFLFRTPGRDPWVMAYQGVLHLPADVVPEKVYVKGYKAFLDPYFGDEEPPRPDVVSVGFRIPETVFRNKA